MIYDVVIAGGGPAGLFLSCELRLVDISVLVLEQAEEPHSPLKRLPFGLRGLSAPTIEAFYCRGLLDKLIASQRTNDESGGSSAAAHWLQRRADQADISQASSSSSTTSTPRNGRTVCQARRAPAWRSMEQIESVLADRARAMGVDVRRGFGIEDFDPSGDEVTLRAGAEIFRGRWLVGCDGGRSTVRKVGGFEFGGTDPEFTGYSVEVEMTDPDKLSLGRHYTPTGMYTYTRPGTIAIVEFDGGAFHRIEPRLTTLRRCCAACPAPTSP